jgi:hypothetical protein
MTLHRRLSLLTVALSVSLSLAATWSHADPIQWSGNQHWYERVPGTLTWPEANAAAQSMSWMGFQGHLATLTSAEEDQFVSSRFYGWCGAYQDPLDEPDPAANWVWVTGEPWLYTNWALGEPNDYMGVPECYVNFGSGGWNDSPDLAWDWGFVVEYEGPALGACCFPSTYCLQLTVADCVGAGGTYIGDGVPCDPDPCGATPVTPTTWGRVKANFR